MTTTPTVTTDTTPTRKTRRPVRRDKKAQLAMPEWTGNGWRGYVWDSDLREKIWVENPETGTTIFPGDSTGKSACRAAQRALRTQMDELYTNAGAPLIRQVHRHPFPEVAQEWCDQAGGGTETERTTAARQTAVNVLSRQFPVDVREVAEADYKAYMRYEAAPKDKNGKPKKPISTATIANRVTYMRQIMEFAEKKGYIDFGTNPMAKIRPPEVVRLKNPRVLTDDEMTHLAGFVPEWFVAAIYLGYDCGLRAAEIAGLRWERIDLDAEQPQALIQDVMERTKIIREMPKGKTPQTVTLTPRVVEALRKLRALRPHDDMVFRTARGTTLDPRTPSKLLAHAVKEAEFAGQAPTFHSLRHSFITNLARAGVEASVIMRKARHKNLSTTQRYIEAANLELQAEADTKVTAMHEARRQAAQAKAQPAGETQAVQADGMMTVSVEQFTAMQAMIAAFAGHATGVPTGAMA
jgi:integrase/recombinase XerD